LTAVAVSDRSNFHGRIVDEVAMTSTILQDKALEKGIGGSVRQGAAEQIFVHW